MAASREWAVIIPFFNEANFLPATLASVAAQNVALQLILVDNGSTDGSSSVAAVECERLGLDYILLKERRPGKVSALSRGLREVRSLYVATFDADTIYPAAYLRTARKLLERPGAVAAQAFFSRSEWADWRRSLRGIRVSGARWLLPHQCHSGGAGQVFHAEILRRAGGFDPSRWDLILEDHEIAHRVSRYGKIEYGLDFWCCPLRREADLPHIRWNFTERILYHLSPAPLQSPFFYRFLGPRLHARKQLSAAARPRHPYVD